MALPRFAQLSTRYGKAFHALLGLKGFKTVGDRESARILRCHGLNPAGSDTRQSRPRFRERRFRHRHKDGTRTVERVFSFRIERQQLADCGFVRFKADLDNFLLLLW